MPARPANWCATCGLDFASVRGFDRHRVGVHAFTLSEGLALDPPREDGRRCLDVVELAGLGFELDGRGRWRDAAEAERARVRFSERPVSLPGVAQDAPGDAPGTPLRVVA
jgi:hypothetical protein